MTFCSPRQPKGKRNHYHRIRDLNFTASLLVPLVMTSCWSPCCSSALLHTVQLCENQIRSIRQPDGPTGLMHRAAASKEKSQLFLLLVTHQSQRSLEKWGKANRSALCIRRFIFMIMHVVTHCRRSTTRNMASQVKRRRGQANMPR